MDRMIGEILRLFGPMPVSGRAPGEGVACQGRCGGKPTGPELGIVSRLLMHRVATVAGAMRGKAVRSENP